MSHVAIERTGATPTPSRVALGPTSVRTKILASLLFVSILPLIGLGVVAYQRQADGFEREALKRLELSANALEQQLDNQVSRDITLVNQVASDRSLQLALQAQTLDPSNDELRAALRTETFRLVSFPIVSVTVLDADAAIITSTEPSAAHFVDGGALDAVQRQQLLGFVTTGRRGQTVSVTHTAVRVDGVRLGTVLLEVELTALNDSTTDYRGLGETGEVTLVQRLASGNAQLIAPQRISGERAFETVIDAGDADAPEIRALNGEEVSLPRYVDSRSVETLVVTRSLDLSGWGLVVKVDRSEALVVADDFRTVVVAAVAIAASIVLVLSWIVTAMITRPIRVLTDAATAISGGALDRRAPVTSGDELGTLAQAFNDMTDELVDIAGHEAERTSQLQQSNRLLHESENRIRAILDHAADGIMHIGGDGSLLEFNEAVTRILGFPTSSLVGRDVGLFLLPTAELETDADVLHGLLPLAASKGHLGLQAWAKRSDGSRVPIHLTVSRIDDGPEHTYTALMRDVSERLEFEQQLEFQAQHDALTGLPNREVLVRELHNSLVELRNGSRPIGLLFLDVDRFKSVNDTLGHQAGDDLLCQVSNRLREAVRPTDLVARFGGDEFVVLARGLRDADDMLIVANRVASSAIKPFNLGGEEVFTSFSVGIVVNEDGRSDTETMIGNADVAMYRAKQGGRNRIEVFDEQMRERINARHDLGTALRKAIENDELYCDYQPIYDLATGEMSGVEALARWDRPGVGAVSPAEFIPVAEETDLIFGLGRTILRRACLQLVEWTTAHPERPLRMSVNLSGKELADSDCVEVLKHVIDETGVDPTLLTLEVTETVLLDDLARAIATLHELRELGICLAIDDFGTGYSSLTYLREFPIDIVKIDRSFMSELEDEHQFTPIVEMVITLARNLKLQVVAEGVENAVQAERLRALGCDLVQGFYFARPSSPAQIAQLAWPSNTDAATQYV